MHILNVIKGPITSIIGLVIIGFTIYGLYFTDTIELIWEGLAGLTAGLILFIMSDSVVKPLVEIAKKIVNIKSKE